ncbi:acyltransferase [Chryseobacterium nematophagum]|uniref:Acyltransferase n=1 Tax=Chryseobacterium nematophagum TaxID=2305228 RepID=A0A3M7LDN1_9FLAO|nr:acyltransferase [Chryseobacterium nematophagum]RMZ60841.1 acyltransferase [Chryseobacterium nematophagum]
MIKPLTSIRFFFAFMVFASHLDFLQNSNSKILHWIYNYIFQEGYIGVSFFFILSGFILAYNYQDDLINKRRSKRLFYIARFARVYPLHLLTFFISIPLTYPQFVKDKSLWFMQALTNITLTQSFIPLNSFYFTFNYLSWSISNEIFFYAAFPALILLLTRLKKHRILTILIILSIIPVLAVIVPSSWYHPIFYINPFMRVIDFIIGILLFNAYKKILNREFKINYSWVEFSAILLLIIFFVFHQQIPQVARYSFYYWIPMSYLIFSFSFQKGIISRFLSHKTFIYLGEISFGFYMFHQIVLRYLSYLNSKILHMNYGIYFTLIAFIVSLIISHYSFGWFETPVNKYINKKFKKIYSREDLQKVA